MSESDSEQIYKQGGIINVSEEEIIIKPLWGWSALIFLCLLIFGWGMFIMMNVKDTDRRWDFGEYEDTPGSSVLSSSDQDYRQAPEQIQLPGKSGKTHPQSPAPAKVQSPDSGGTR